MHPALQRDLCYGMRPTRRHITSHDQNGASVVLASPNLLYLDRGGYAITRTYALDQVPAQLGKDQDLNAYLSSDGDNYPTSQLHGGSQPVVPGGVNFLQGDFGPSAITPMHRTISVDYVVVVEGELVLELDDGTKTPLKIGDSVIQRATMHRWVNPSVDKPARFVATTVACIPFEIEGHLIQQEYSD
ncbi:hypothetical protein PCG10_002602 [Penicillium crustosum]|uniref:Cupin type-2 domain-containing protein n=1 Tax=Penicillium crustosum TaxID=36656 RepID=A0A9P5L6X1_PENCR|nr:uncharacterized protein N7487_008936 [Penicillium crustosum]KAF7527638.1 hypothetical protein PCG10_002602 [Penicillium crustosum]KAJ5403040.1 hypothetical protein N7487_008936 [Penicillium crustosum]